MTPLDELYASTGGDGAAYAQGYARHQIQLLERLDAPAIAAVARLMLECWRSGHTVFCVGNGGSAATAAHFVTDLMWGHRDGVTEPPRVIALTTNLALLTAVGNDVSYDEVFVEQLRGLLRPGDLVVAISVSGNSPNVLRAVQFARERGGQAIGLVGCDGGRLKSLCAACVHVATAKGEYEVAEDVHHTACHIIASFVKRQIVRSAPSDALTSPVRG